MPKWLFATGVTRGSYTAVEENGDLREVVGLDLVLGIQDGETVEEALEKLLVALGKSNSIPAYLKEDIVAHRVEGSRTIRLNSHLKKAKVEIDEELTSAEKQTKTVTKPEKDVAGGYKKKKCEYCNEEVCSNGAAQFSHLKKHVTQLAGKGELSPEQVNSIRKLKLEPGIQAIFAKNFKKNANVG